MTDIIIIGAGAAGLTAARVASKEGKSVTVLEARPRAGGRINTLHEQEFSIPVEAGAEFIHGSLPYTTSLLKEANISFYESDGATWNVIKGKLEEGDMFPEEWEEFLEKLKQLKHDMSIAEFLDQHFQEQKYESLRNAIIRFVQGYDAADANQASALALREEWSSEENLTGYRPRGGYFLLIDFLLQECRKQGVAFHFENEVQYIQWKAGSVEVTTRQGERYISKKILITIPPAVLKCGSIKITPSIEKHMKSIHAIQTGGVIKFLVEFKEAFWEQKNSQPYRSMPNLNFIFSDASIPTWWTQHPVPIPLLTGWLAGPKALDDQKDDEALLQEAVESLSYIFGCTIHQLKYQVKAMRVLNWVADPFSRGAYAYKTVNTSSALEVLSQPISHTLYFAGEAFYSGAEMGTVEAALASGTTVAKKMLLENPV
ncbi:flavin monoamine oxidase family protein [Ohtaekwangia koreensis]|uniref:Tryptophan 2-monooxygenase n=1 Tax=Ohtaekwangia koreensis TaxID=688867 RepID=A0A1T5LGC7_9BACT|nr:NAD(P)/FAD-dependent oxidoreductase [Ohtaekwangia koreensis]SKC75053.1 Monoamine oxidase [Ohtaekwangia koreensis]